MYKTRPAFLLFWGEFQTHSGMKISLHECRSGAPFHEQKKSCEAAESTESAVKPSVEGFANGAE